MTILWAHTRLSAHFHPSNHYIPPDPLLPLRSLLLHQPIGSGSLTASPGSNRSSGTGGWQLSFGTGTIGSESKPSLTGSLVGLASSLVSSGSAGSLEEERRKAWNTKDLPVFETARSLLGVDMKVKEGEKREFTYSIPIPANLPPTHRGRAFKFGWEFVLSLAVTDGGLSGAKAEQRTREIEVPVRVWSHVSLGTSSQPYDVLKPIIQRQDTGNVLEMTSRQSAPDVAGDQPSKLDRGTSSTQGRDTVQSLEEYARRLLPNNAQVGGTSHLETSKVVTGNQLEIPNGRGPARSRRGSFVQEDSFDVAEDDGNNDGDCGQAVEVLSRHTTKASFDIAKDGDLVSVFTLIKTTYRLGETVLGVIDINQPNSSRQVLKSSAFLESHDLIPTPLLPLSPRGGRSSQPSLIRTHAEFNAGYITHTTRLAFNLDIPSEATPFFAFDALEDGAAGKDEQEDKGELGGVEWKIRLAFLVTSPIPLTGKGVSGNLVPSGKDSDNRFYTATTSLAPLVHIPSMGDKGEENTGAGHREEVGTETVECEIPIRVLPGNSAFKVRPAVYTL